MSDTKTKLNKAKCIEGNGYLEKLEAELLRIIRERSSRLASGAAIQEPLRE